MQVTMHEQLVKALYLLLIVFLFFESQNKQQYTGWFGRTAAHVQGRPFLRSLPKSCVVSNASIP